MTFKPVSFTLAASMVLASVTAPAWATEDDGIGCACRLANVSAPGPVGAIEESFGEVLTSAKAGLIQAQAGTPLVKGSQVVVGPNSTARLSLGSECSVGVLNNSEAVVVQEGQDICLRIYETGITTQGTIVGQQEAESVEDEDEVVGGDILRDGAVVGTVTATGVILYFVFADDDDGAS